MSRELLSQGRRAGWLPGSCQGHLGRFPAGQAINATVPSMGPLIHTQFLKRGVIDTQFIAFM